MTQKELEDLVTALARDTIGWRTEIEQREYLESRALLWRHVRKLQLERELADLTARQTEDR